MNNDVIKSKAKADIGGKIFGENWLVMVLACFLSSVILGAGSSLSVKFGDEGQFRFSYGSIIGFVLGGAMSYGLARIAANLIRNKTAKIELLIDGFKENFVQTMILGMVREVLIMLWSLLLIVPGIMKAYSYSMAPHIQQDSDNKDWKYCLTMSKTVMNGKRKQLFWLDVSFIPYYILGLICLGIGIYWVAAWHQTARATFYENVVLADLPKSESENRAVVLPLTDEERPVCTDEPTENETSRSSSENDNNLQF